MKVCRKGHEYDAKRTRCPECKRLYNAGPFARGLRLLWSLRNVEKTNRISAESMRRGYWKDPERARAAARKRHRLVVSKGLLAAHRFWRKQAGLEEVARAA